MRSDKKDEPRISITARLVADLLQAAGANRVLAVDLHSPQVQGFFSIPSDHLTARTILADYIRSRPDLANHVVVAPDAGGVRLNLPGILPHGKSSMRRGMVERRIASAHDL